MTIHAFDCECEAYACRMRKKSIQVSPAGMVKHNRKPPAKHQYNNWEKGKAGEKRPDGSFMPYLDRNGSAIPIKSHSEGGFHKAEKALERARQLNTTR